MELNDFLSLIKNKKTTIFSLLTLFILLGMIFIVVQPFKYSAQARLLIVNETNGTQDPYTASRSSEYLSSLLAKITYSNSFFNRVMDSSFNIDKSYFGEDLKKQTKAWSRTINVESVNDTGIIAIEVLHKDREQADQIVKAMSYILMTQHSSYHGLGDGVKIKMIDYSVLSNYPVSPNILVIMSLAVCLGLIFSLACIYLLPEEKYSFNIFGRKSQLLVDNNAWQNESIINAEQIRLGQYDSQWTPAAIDNQDQVINTEEPVADENLSADDILSNGNINNILR